MCRETCAIWCGPKSRRRSTRSRRSWTSFPARCRRTSPLAPTNLLPPHGPARAMLDALSCSHHPGQTNISSARRVPLSREFRRLHRFAGGADRTHRAPARRASAAVRRDAGPTIWSRHCLTLPIPQSSDIALKVGACVVIGYVIGIVDHRPELNTILTTVIITALPTYGAALRKMNLRIVGALIGGLISLLTIIIVTPNFSGPFRLIRSPSSWSSMSPRTALSAADGCPYAGKQIGTTFALVFTGLSAALDVHEPLWRIWAFLLGTLVGYLSLSCCGRNMPVTLCCRGCVTFFATCLRSRRRFRGEH